MFSFLVLYSDLNNCLELKKQTTRILHVIFFQYLFTVIFKNNWSIVILGGVLNSALFSCESSVLVQVVH